MSAFLVENETIDRILTKLSYLVSHEHYLAEKMKDMTGIAVEDDNWKDKLGILMLNMNQMSLGEQYGDKLTRHGYKYQPRLANNMQYLKSLQCFNYQCSEGIIVNLQLYKFFNDILERKLAFEIIYAMPEYNKAEWA